MKERIVEIVYIDIESLLDLRQGLLSTKGLSHQELMLYLISDEFMERQSENIQHFERDEYRNAVESGNMDLVKGSILTYNINILNDQIARHNLYSGIDDKMRDVRVWVNVYPFEFTEEQKELIKDAIFVNLKIPSHIEIIEIDTKALSPSLIATNNIRTFFIYNYKDWLNTFNEELKNNPMADRTAYFPLVYHDNFTQEDLDKYKTLNFKDPIAMLSFLYSPLLKIIFNPLVFYSNNIIATEKMKEYERMSKEVIERKRKENPDLEHIIQEMVDGYTSE